MRLRRGSSRARATRTMRPARRAPRRPRPRAPTDCAGRSRRDPLVDRNQATRDVVPRIPIDGDAPRTFTERAPPRLVVEERGDARGKRTLVPGRKRDPRLRRHDVTVPGNVRGDDGRGAGERTCQGHSEALTAE